MKFTLMISGFLLMVSRSVCVEIIVRGTEGEHVTITCPYAKGYEKEIKYFYKGPYRDNNLLLKSDGGESSVSGGRFSLSDNHQRSLFTVTIRNLRMSDAGEYLCAAGWGEYTNIPLNVIKAPQKTRPVQISTSTLHPAPQKTRPVQISTSTIHSYTNTSTDQTSTVTPKTASETTRTMTGSTAVHLDHRKTNLSSVAGGLGSVLLVLVLCSGMFLILKKRKRKSGTALFQQNVQHNTKSERMYEAIPNSDVIATTSSSNQTPASQLNTRPQDSAVYATVTNHSKPSRIPSTNQVTDTDSTNQVTYTDGDYYANMKSPEPTTDSRKELIYATVTHPQNIKTNDGQIYSVIKHK